MECKKIDWTIVAVAAIPVGWVLGWPLWMYLITPTTQWWILLLVGIPAIFTILSAPITLIISIKEGKDRRAHFERVADGWDVKYTEKMGTCELVDLINEAIDKDEEDRKKQIVDLKERLAKDNLTVEQYNVEEKLIDVRANKLTLPEKLKAWDKLLKDGDITPLEYKKRKELIK